MKKIPIVLLLLLIGLFISTRFTLHCTAKGNTTYLSASVVILNNLESFNAVVLAYKVADVYLEEHLEPAQAKNDKKENPT